jgi:asparagine synthase (glutamine-hydrolysing)
VALVFNGEIYNYRALRDELIALGHVFRTRPTPKSCCTPGSLGRRLRAAPARHVRLRHLGPRQQTLFLARDHVGVKPMHYSLLPDGLFVFGSELKSIMSFPNCRATSTRARSRIISPTATCRSRAPFSATPTSCSPGHTMTC